MERGRQVSLARGGWAGPSRLRAGTPGSPPAEPRLGGMETLDASSRRLGCSRALPASSVAGWAEGAWFPSFPFLLWTPYVNKDAICFKKIR